MERVEIELDGRTISLEAGDLARQAGGSVIEDKETQWFWLQQPWHQNQERE